MVYTLNAIGRLVLRPLTTLRCFACFINVPICSAAVRSGVVPVFHDLGIDPPQVLPLARTTFLAAFLQLGAVFNNGFFYLEPERGIALRSARSRLHFLFASRDIIPRKNPRFPLKRKYRGPMQ